jgi:formate dehydrogenase major subunit
MHVSRRQFFTICGTGLGGSSMVLMGFSSAPFLAEIREFKLLRVTETRNTCPYCSVSCGLLMYSLGDNSKNSKPAIIHIKGDPDHPVNRGTLCPKGAALLDFVQSPNRLTCPEVREPRVKEWKRISRDEAIGRMSPNLLFTPCRDTGLHGCG